MAAWLKSVMSILMKHGRQSQPLDKGGLASEHSALEACVWSEARRDWLPSHWQHVKPQLIGQMASWVIIFVQHCQEHSIGVRPQGERWLGLICLKINTEPTIYETKPIVKSRDVKYNDCTGSVEEKACNFSEHYKHTQCFLRNWQHSCCEAENVQVHTCLLFTKCAKDK